MNLEEVGLCSSITERTEDSIFMPRMHLYFEKTKRKIVQKGWIRSNEQFVPVLEEEVCKTIGGCSLEVYVPSLFEDQTTSWIKIVSGVQKYVREAIPIQQGEEAVVRPAAKVKPILKPASTSNPNVIPMRDRRWIDIEVQKIKGPILPPDVEVHH